jgi:HTH-type transcriptional regulator / antitoxin HigA
MNKIIKTTSEYTSALNELEVLIDKEPKKGTPDSDRLELLSLLIQEYEKTKIKKELPDPIEAIKFRMEQQNLTPRDLIPFIGSRSKVSEILSRKRPLTLQMIRALHEGLAIPAGVLLMDGDTTNSEEHLDWSRFPVKEMIRRGWLKTTDIRENIEYDLRKFIKSINPAVASEALYRKSDHIRSGRQMDSYALAAWTARIVNKANKISDIGAIPDMLDVAFLRKVVQLSWSANGPVLAQEFLLNNGIPLIIEPHLPHTQLDGAAILIENKNPIVGLTIRYDRLDNFWFTLMHELAHIVLHRGGEFTEFYDDLDIDDHTDIKEVEADELAGEALIPAEIWRKSPASRLASPQAAQLLAKQLEISPAIVAGRMRHEYKAFKMLNNLVGHRQARKLFPDISWE